MNIKQFFERKVPRNRVLLLIVLDVLILSLAGFIALYIRYDFKFGNMAMRFVHCELKALPVNVLIAMAFFVLFRLYRSVWHFASATELLNVMLACFCTAGGQVLWMSLVKWRMPISYYLIKYTIVIFSVGSVRFGYRILQMFKEIGIAQKNGDRKRTMIIGAGEAGAMIIKELQNSRYLDQNVCCVIDDNGDKHGKYIRGIRIMGAVKIFVGWLMN